MNTAPTPLLPVPCIVTLEHLFHLHASVESRCPERRGHGIRTAGSVVRLGRRLGLPETQLQDLHWAGLFHDLGLVTIPSELVMASQELTPEEYRQVQSHPRFGARIVEQVPWLHAASILIAHHHEHWDGTGYPFGLREHMIPLGARILALADACDAWQIESPEHPRPDAETVFGILRHGAGTLYDPQLVTLLCQFRIGQRPKCQSSSPTYREARG